MTTQTLLGHLGLVLTQQTENLATEALTFILKGSSTARTTIAQLVSQAVVALPEGLNFQNQVEGDEGDRPDISGTDPDGYERLLIEAKFWAGLTTNQPDVYLKHFVSESPCVLLFIVPEMRIDSFWPELIRVCRQSNNSLLECSTLPKWRKAQLEDKRFLAMTSWRVVLQALEVAVSPLEAENVRQLKGLCDRMDTDAFLPLRPLDMSPEIPRLVIQLNVLLDDVVGRICEKGIADTEHLKHRRSATDYGHYIRLVKSVYASVRIDYGYWKDQRQTPLWLILAGTDWHGANIDKCVTCLNKWKTADPPRLFVKDDEIRIPILLRLGVEKEHVLDEVVKEISDIADQLKGITPGSSSVLSPPPTSE